VANVVTLMIALLPQKGQRHQSANGVADEEQSQWVSGCFIGGTLLAARFNDLIYKAMRSGKPLR
jgi:hypothetical protein